MLNRCVCLLLACGLPLAAAADVAWRADPVLAAQFLPHGPMRADFDLAVSEAPLSECVARERAKHRPASASDPAGRLSWTIERAAPLDGFGTIGGYDRAALVKLFGARRVLVARGPVINGTRVVGSATLLSPYPDPTMTRLLPGTLRILTWLPR